MPTSTSEKQTISFSKLIPDFKHFVTRTKTRPILKNICNQGQFTVATDSHIAIKIDNSIISEGIEESKMFDPKTNSLGESIIHYPDMSRLFPYAADNKFRLYKNQLVELITDLKAVRKVVKPLKNKEVKFTLSDQKELSIHGIVHYVVRKGDDLIPDDEYSNTINIAHPFDSFKVYLNSDLMIKVLSAMNTYLKQTKNNYIMMNFYSSMRPILLSSEDEKFQTLIMPVRTF